MSHDFGSNVEYLVVAGGGSGPSFLMEVDLEVQ